MIPLPRPGSVFYLYGPLYCTVYRTGDYLDLFLEKVYVRIEKALWYAGQNIFKQLKSPVAMNNIFGGKDDLDD